MFFLLICICICNAFVESKSKLGDLIPVCNLNDVNVDDCLKTSSQMILPIIAKDVPDWNLTGLDPAFVPFISFGHNEGPINMKWELLNTTITGCSEFNITRASISKKGGFYHFSYNITSNGIGLKGEYEAKGKILLFPIKNSGYEDLLLESSKLNLIFEGKPEKRRKQKYLKIKKFQLDFGLPKSVKITLKNSQDKPTQLDVIMSKFLEDNSNTIMEELRPTIGTVMGQLIRVYVQNFLDKVPVKQLFIE